MPEAAKIYLYGNDNPAVNAEAVHQDGFYLARGALVLIWTLSNSLNFPDPIGTYPRNRGISHRKFIADGWLRIASTAISMNQYMNEST